MRFLWLLTLFIVVALLVIALAAWRRWRKSPTNQVWVANAQTLKSLPSYRRALATSRSSIGSLGVALVIAFVAAAVLAAGPIDRRVENPVLARRDLVLCLDASGSMLPYDGQILQTMSDLVAKFSGERLALHLWSAQTIVKLPLTDDYPLIQQVLDQAADVIDSGYLGVEGEYVMVTPQLSDYLQGVDAPDGAEIASLIGDGLASCVLGFDNRDAERSRTIILATDNEVMGPQIYTIEQAVKFASDQGVRIIALYPALSGVLTAEGEQLKQVVEDAGGAFYIAEDPGTIDGIIADIQSQQLAEAEGQSRVIETDRPRTPLIWAAMMSLAALGLLSWRRL